MKEPKINRIYYGDNLDILRKFPDNCIDLICTDPPFNSNRNYDMTFPSGTNFTAFSDRWECGIKTYVEYMMPRIQEIHRILKPTGTFYLHCDHHASHYLKIICDIVFNIKNFRNEIVWTFSGGGIPKKDFPRKHHILFRYTKTENYTFNIEYKPYSKASKSVGKHKNGTPLRELGTPITDYWDDIKPLSGFVNCDKRVGFNGKKPVVLYERMIRASSNENDIVLDPFVGSGTTLIAAQNLNRNWIGIDLQIEACKLTCNLLRKKDWIIINYPYTLKTIKSLTPLEYQRWCIVNKLQGVDYGNDTIGIDGYIFNYIYNNIILQNKIAIQVKFKQVSRGDVSKFYGAIRANKSFSQSYGILIGFSENGFSAFSKGKNGALNEIMRLKNEENFEMIMIDGFVWLEDFKKITEFNKKYDNNILSQSNFKTTTKKQINLTEFL